MKKGIRTVLVFTVFFIAFICLAVAGSCETIDSGTCETNPSISWSIDDNGTLTFTGSGILKRAYFDGYEDVEEYSWGSYKDIVKYIVVGEGITSLSEIWNYADWYTGTFENFAALEEISLPESLKTIGAGCFRNCKKLTGIRIPDAVEHIGYSAFVNCESITEISIPFGVIIDNDDDMYNSPAVFGNCISLTKVNIPGVLKISNYWNNNEWDSIFANCPITTVCFLDGSQEINVPCRKISDCITEVSIPDGVTAIGNAVFSECSQINEITVPSSVTDIGEDAFYACAGLNRVNISSLEAWCGITFGNADSNPLKYANEFCLNGSLVTDITVPDAVTMIPAYAFYGYGPLTNIVLSQNVTDVETGAFYRGEGSDLPQLTITFENPDCNIPSDPYYFDNNTLIIGKHNSTAYEYTKLFNKSFAYSDAHVFETMLQVPSACDSYGFVLSRCSCGLEQNETILPLGHKDENNDGLCDTCGLAMTSSAGHVHTEGEWTVKKESTCADNGIKVKKCVTCDAILDVAIIDRLPHTVSGWIVDADPTCVLDGVKHTKCTVCGVYVDLEDIPAAGHAPRLVGAIAPTAESEGYTGDTVCAVCGDLIEKGNSIPAENKPVEDNNDQPVKQSFFNRIIQWIRDIIEKIKAIFSR